MTVTSEISVHGGVVVAHDGSPSATTALRTAILCAKVFGDHVEVVRAWSVANAPVPAEMIHGYIPPLDEFEAATLADLESDVEAVRSEHPDVAISCSVVHGNIAEKLVEASEHVDLIVLGRRGHGGFVGLLLGSATDQVAHHAKCRVLIDG